jgi:HTH-type transcriptional regulator, sugar sensing transcriptional regulator
MNIVKLGELGLTKGQISVYGAILELGIASINKIHEKTGLERRAIYDILNKLIEKGMVTYIVEKGRRTFRCTPPAIISQEIEKKQQGLKELQQLMPQIIAVYTEKKTEVGAEIFRGNEAIKAMLEDALNYNETYWIGGNSGIEGTPLKAWFSHWMQRRAEKKAKMFDLVDFGTFLEGYEPNKKQQNEKRLYFYKQLPKQLSSPMVIIIYGNKVAQILWSKQSFAFVLESREIEESFMKYFNMFWESKEANK